MIARLIRRVVPATVRRRIRARWTALRPPTMSDGLGRGLRFDPGPSNAEYSRGDNEMPVQSAFAGHVAPGGVVVDIGANVGFFAMLGARLVGPTGRVVAFEPVPSNAELVRKNARLNGFANVTVVEKAVADREGTAELLLAEYSGGAALATAGAPPDPAGVLQVPTITIDAALARREIPSPTLVKIDVEGAELEVLRGMADTLRTVRPVVICEVDDGEPSKFAAKYEACADLVREAGYDVQRLDDSYTGAWIVGHFLATPRASDQHTSTR